MHDRVNGVIILIVTALVAFDVIGISLLEQASKVVSAILISGFS